MTLSAAKRYANKLEEEGITAKVWEHYSGRGMIGKAAPALVLDSNYVLESAFRICPGLKKYQRDSMGKGVVLY